MHYNYICEIFVAWNRPESAMALHALWVLHARRRRAQSVADHQLRVVHRRRWGQHRGQGAIVPQIPQRSAPTARLSHAAATLTIAALRPSRGLLSARPARRRPREEGGSLQGPAARRGRRGARSFTSQRFDITVSPALTYFHSSHMTSDDLKYTIFNFSALGEGGPLYEFVNFLSYWHAGK